MSGPCDSLTQEGGESERANKDLKLVVQARPFAVLVADRLRITVGIWRNKQAESTPRNAHPTTYLLSGRVAITLRRHRAPLRRDTAALAGLGCVPVVGLDEVGCALSLSLFLLLVLHPRAQRR
jgi:hypothetical protein